MKYLNLAKRILGPEKQDSRLTSQLLLTFCLLMSGILSYTIESLDTMESGKLILIVGDETRTERDSSTTLARPKAYALSSTSLPVRSVVLYLLSYPIELYSFLSRSCSSTSGFGEDTSLPRL